MDLRRLLNVAYAHLLRDLSASKRAEVISDLEGKFPYELTPAEQRTAEYRKKAAELGIDLSQQRALMGAFALKTADS